MKDFFRHHLLPHHTNNHRPKVLHRQSLFIVIVLLLVTSFAFSFIQRDYPNVLGISANISIDDLLTATNQKRQENGLAPLALNGQLSQAAEKKAQHMFANNYWAHVGPDGTTPWVFIKGAGFDYLYAGENLARGFTNPKEVVDAWMASPTHRENLLSTNYKEIGFAISQGQLTGTETVLVVQMFGTKYAGKDQDVNAPDIVALISPQPQQTGAPTPTLGIVLPSQAPVQATTGDSTLKRSDQTAVAALKNEPLVDTHAAKKNIGLFVLVFFIAILIIDAIIIERKQIVRVVSHNLDHILFLIVILLVIIIIERGVVL